MAPNAGQSTEGSSKVWSSIWQRVANPQPSLIAFFLSLVSVSCWAFAGNASRISLTAAFKNKSFYKGYTCFGPNSLGSFSIGIVQSCFPAESNMPLLQRGLCVGFCGAFTTLSTWMLNVANSKSFPDAAEELLSGIAFSLIFYLVGADIGAAVGSIASMKIFAMNHDCNETQEPTELEEQQIISCAPSTYWIIDVVVLIVIACASIVLPLTLFLIQHYHRPAGGTVGTMSADDLRDVMFAPCGAVPRFIVSYLFNKHPEWRDFPVGTLLCNMVAVVLATLLYREMDNKNPSWRYSAILVGVCGSLSTVSSVVSEVVGFYRSKEVGLSYGYGLITLGVSLLIAGIGRQANF